VALEVNDIDFQRCILRCHHRDSTRDIRLTADVARLVRDYIENGRLDLLYNDTETALFLNRRGHRLTRQGFWQIVKNYANKAGLGNRVTPHTLRHSFAVRKLQTGTDLKSLQQTLGHAYISSTRVYRQPVSSAK